MIKLINLSLVLFIFFNLIAFDLIAQPNMTNVYGRRVQSLNLSK